MSRRLIKWVTVAYSGEPNAKKDESFMRVVGRFDGAFSGSGFDLVMQERDLEAKFASLPPDQEKKLRAELKRLGFNEIEVRTITPDNWPNRQSFA